jgi:hypothetical protein
MKHIKEIRTFTTFNELYKDFINTLNVEDTDFNKSIIYREIESKGLIEDNSILFIHDEFNLLK